MVHGDIGIMSLRREVATAEVLVFHAMKTESQKQKRRRPEMIGERARGIIEETNCNTEAKPRNRQIFARMALLGSVEAKGGLKSEGAKKHGKAFHNFSKFYF